MKTIKQYELGLADYIRILKRRVWSIIFVTIAVFLIVFIYSRSIPPIYKTSANIEVTKAIATEGMEKWLYYKGHPIETAMRQIRSPACIEAALRKMGMLTDSSPQSEIQAKVGQMTGIISVSELPNTNMITVSASGPDPNILENYVNSLCEVYQKLEREWDRKEDDEVIDFLEKRIELYRKRLEDAEAAMIEFKRTNVVRGFGSDVGAQLKMRQDLMIEASRISDEIDEMKQKSETAWMRDIPQITSILQQKRDLESKKSAILERYTPNHPSLVAINENLEWLDSQIEELKKNYEKDRMERLEKAIHSREGNLADIRRRIAELDAALSTMSSDQVIYSNLDMELSLSKNLYSMFWERLEQQKIIRQSKSGGVNLTGAAAAPVKIYPNERAHQTVGLALGMMIGLAFAFLLETMDTSIRTIEEIEEFIGLPVLGVAPIVVLEPPEKIDTERGPGFLEYESPGTVLYYHPRDPSSEAYRSLASTLEFTFFNEGNRVLLFASATPQEGKTTSSANIGIALALAGKRTIILDCNLRHPGISKIFSLMGHSGASEVLNGYIPWRIGVYPTLVENLDVMPTGALPGQPVELLKMGLGNLLRELSSIYSAILIDCPPILPVADASIISSMAGGTVIVYSQGRSPRDVLLRAKSKLETAGGRVLGIFLNKVRPEGDLGRNYYYHYYSYYPNKEQRIEKDRVS